MSLKRISIMASIPLLVAGVAYGQTVPATNSTAQTPPSMQYQQPMSSSPASTFDRLAGSKGYVTKSDAAQAPWLSSHFSTCDSNRDGKVARSEFDTCHRQQGMQTPQSSGRG